MKRIALLGSTGSIGCNALRVAKHLESEFQVVSLAAHSNIDLLEEQAKAFSPQVIGVYDQEKALELAKRLPQCEVIGGDEGLLAVATHPEADLVISAIAGTKGLVPTVAAVEAGKDIALANKEVLVSGGALFMDLVKKKGVDLLPIDSEHSALFQCLEGKKIEDVRRIILTASGGPFRDFTQEKLKSVTLDHALRHPNWNMGAKVTIDSSTLMNKGLEVIEAHWLYGVPIEQIEVVIHPQSIIHSLVEYIDGAMLAQLGLPDMILPIQYAMTYPKKYPGLMQPYDFVKNHTLQFFQPDTKKFRCLDLAYQAIKSGGSLPCYMNAANEGLVNRFIDRQIGWTDIPTKLETLMQRHNIQKKLSLDHLLEVDAEARKDALSV